eukprot:CAMPEP_0197435816 /NCGR_PEP_ID=MMETSP1175-20131217/3324_1 /TAXON_ID=1003142 /ORGANISM="Triceratium dubium, Strain CCMP147" /LENGTH=583 /DNA_ID=CAMNT_0042964933 /DNA_START=449 /DNA_END=2200 /DNA_ORIENTATION=-
MNSSDDEGGAKKPPSPNSYKDEGGAKQPSATRLENTSATALFDTVDGQPFVSAARISDNAPPKDVASAPSVAVAAPVELGSRKPGRKRKWTWKKPKDRPKRPLSSYNFFFQHERSNILARSRTINNYSGNDGGGSEGDVGEGATVSTGGPGFEDLARQIAQRWSTLDDSSRSVFEVLASADKRRHDAEMKVWRLKMSSRSIQNADDNDGTFVDVGSTNAEVDVADSGKKQRAQSSFSSSEIMASEEGPKVSSFVSPALPPANRGGSFTSTSSFLGGTPAHSPHPSRITASSMGQPVSYAGKESHTGRPGPSSIAAAGSSELDPNRVAKNYERLRRIYYASVQPAGVPPPLSSIEEMEAHNFPWDGLPAATETNACAEMGSAKDGRRDAAPLVTNAVEQNDSVEEFASLIDSLPRQGTPPENELNIDADRKEDEVKDGEKLKRGGGPSQLDHDDPQRSGRNNAWLECQARAGIDDPFVDSGDHSFMATSLDDIFGKKQGNFPVEEGRFFGTSEDGLMGEEDCKKEGTGLSPPLRPMHKTTVTEMAAGDDKGVYPVDSTSNDGDEVDGPGKQQEDRQHIFTPRMA